MGQGQLRQDEDPTPSGADGGDCSGIDAAAKAVYAYRNEEQVCGCEDGGEGLESVRGHEVEDERKEGDVG